MTDEGRALLIVAALLSGASGSAGFVGGRASVPVTPAEVRSEIRYVTIEVPAAVPVPLPADVAPIAAPVEPVPAAELRAVSPAVEAKPAPRPKPKVDPKPPAKPKAKPSASKKSLPSCDVVNREFNRMNYAQRMAAYASATAEEIAHGRRCLGF